eukprot:COSAG01_NODE_10464_length_2159_cov_176.909709_3_plen_79_part_01
MQHADSVVNGRAESSGIPDEASPTMAKAAQEIVDTAEFITGEWGEPQTVSFNQRDLLTYAVGIGCTEMKFIYEQDEGFE